MRPACAASTGGSPQESRFAFTQTAPLLDDDFVFYDL